MNRRERFLGACNSIPVDRPPVWLMRQAGRCLPEYRKLKETRSFLELVRTPELAAEVTLQPIRRFGFDAAILFSDILVVPEALGQGYQFREGGGIAMEFTLDDADAIRRLNPAGVTSRLAYVPAAIELIRAELSGKTALIGFSGSPWTLANFMLEGGSSKTHLKALQLFGKRPDLFSLLFEKLTASVMAFLQMQIRAGVDAIQIFDSLGGLVPAGLYEEASGRWIRRIIAALDPAVPVIVFGKGVRDWPTLARSGARVIGIDHECPLGEARHGLPATLALQGNLDPSLLASGTPERIAAATRKLVASMSDRNGYIFNLGHGVPPDANLENISAIVQTLRNSA